MATINEILQGLQNIVPNSNAAGLNVPQYIQSNVEKFKDQPEIASQFKQLGNFGTGVLDDARENIINAYNVFEESTNPAFQNYIQTSLSGGRKIMGDISKQRKQVDEYYGPGGTAEVMINEYITKYGDLLAQQAAGNQALAKNLGLKSGASQAAIRAGVSQQQALDAQNILQFQEKKVVDLSNLYNTYNTIISQLRAEASTANQAYILQPLATILERQSQIASALVQNEANLNNMKIQLGMASSYNEVSDNTVPPTLDEEEDDVGTEVDDYGTEVDITKIMKDFDKKYGVISNLPNT